MVADDNCPQQGLIVIGDRRTSGFLVGMRFAGGDTSLCQLFGESIFMFNRYYTIMAESE